MIFETTSYNIFATQIFFPTSWEQLLQNSQLSEFIVADLNSIIAVQKVAP